MRKTVSVFEDRYGKLADEYLAEIRVTFMQRFAQLVATGEWVPIKRSVDAVDSAARDLADMVFRGERIRNEQPIR